ncbi:hypothetical protein QE152_g15203 [Popillia japonica]|uniref:CCHC-type domain-containing protein n=1 Tax=Popillia japonica TaxID=7064 RepID=A0AAW1L970_POPJA
MEFVKSRLLDEELKLSSKNKVPAQNDEVSFKASITCFKCKKTGYKAAECWTKTNNRGRAFKSYRRGNFRGRLNSDGPSINAHKAETEVSFVALNCDIINDNSQFILDSGATEHLVKGELRQYDSGATEHLVKGELLRGNMQEK